MRDIRSLDLNLLRTLDALLDERSVTRAAARLGLTQPAVSGMRTRLRDSFSDPLSVRTPHGILPTMRASQLAAPLKQILGEVEGLLQPAGFDPATAAFTLSVPATDYAQQAVVLLFLDELRGRAPPVAIPGFSKIAVWHERTHRDAGYRWVRALLFETSGCLASGDCSEG